MKTSPPDPTPIGEAGPQLMSPSPAHVMKLNSFLHENARPPMPFMAETAKLSRPRAIDPGLHNKALLPGDWGHILHHEDEGIRLPALGRDSRGRQWLVPCTHMGVRVCMCVRVRVCICVYVFPPHQPPLPQRCLNGHLI